MTVRDLLRINRSYRRFEQQPIDRQTLVDLIALTRLCPSAANRQPLKYLLAWTPEQTAAIFPHLRWAAALTDWPGPAPEERPPAYIVVLGDTRIWRRWDWDTWPCATPRKPWSWKMALPSRVPTGATRSRRTMSPSVP